MNNSIAHSYSDARPAVPAVVFPAFGQSLPPASGVSRNNAGITPGGASINDRVLAVFAALPLDVPFVQPRDVAPLLGITQNAFTKYCRNHRALRLWKGSYRFFTDDAGHMEILASVIKLVLWSGRKLPGHLRVH